MVPYPDSKNLRKASENSLFREVYSQMSLLEKHLVGYVQGLRLQPQKSGSVALNQAVVNGPSSAILPGMKSGRPLSYLFRTLCRTLNLNKVIVQMPQPPPKDLPDSP